ncbi:hypothetical protein [Actinacidiphila glaucinigra]|uniref:hypothetical protein n=1 Tax=Actinacidiphila glaucinigra TaxID=235986 RepID=UPI003D8E2EF9
MNGIFAAILVVLGGALLYVIFYAYPKKSSDGLPDLERGFSWPMGIILNWMIRNPLAGGAILLVLLLAYLAYVQYVPVRHRDPRPLSIGWLRAARRYALVMEIARAIDACAKAHRTGGEQLPPALRKVSRKLGVVTRGVATAHRQRGAVPYLSHRRTALKAHERRVVAALREREAHLDSDPRRALEELGVLLLTVADRYCEGRVGALLDEDQLQDVVAGPDREWVRIVVWAVLTAGGVVGLSFTGLSDDAQPFVSVLLAVFVAAVVWHRNVRRVFDLIGLVAGP